MAVILQVKQSCFIILQDQLSKAGVGGGEDMEKLELYQALERAEGRIMSLEKQVNDFKLSNIL